MSLHPIDGHFLLLFLVMKRNCGAVGSPLLHFNPEGDLPLLCLRPSDGATMPPLADSSETKDPFLLFFQRRPDSATVSLSDFEK